MIDDWYTCISKPRQELGRCTFNLRDNLGGRSIAFLEYYNSDVLPAIEASALL